MWVRSKNKLLNLDKADQITYSDTEIHLYFGYGMTANTERILTLVRGKDLPEREFDKLRKYLETKFQQKEELKPNYKKIPFIPAYFLLGYLILYLNKNSLIYYPAYNSFADIPRLWGCIAFSFLGFAFLISISIPSRKTRFPWTYLRYYPFICFLGAILVFSGCQLFEKSSGYLFYFIAFPLSFISGILVDSFWGIILHRLRGD